MAKDGEQLAPMKIKWKLPLLVFFKDIRYMENFPTSEILLILYPKKIKFVHGYTLRMSIYVLRCLCLCFYHLILSMEMFVRLLFKLDPIGS